MIVLMAAAADGDQRAWDGLIDRYRPFLQQVTRRYRLSHQESQDVIQVVWPCLEGYSRWWGISRTLYAGKDQRTATKIALTNQ